LHRESLKVTDFAVAKRKLADLKSKLSRTDPRYGDISLVQWLKEEYFPTLRGSEGTLADKWRLIELIERTWVDASSQPMRHLKPGAIKRWLQAEFGQWSPSYHNSALSLLKGALDAAVQDRVLTENPAATLTRRKRERPIRLTPTFEQFLSIVADVRAQVFNADAKDSADFLEAMGLLGLGQAELAGMKRCDVDLDAGRIIVYRHKTDTGFVIPVYPQARALVERLCAGKKANERLFALKQARKALSNACARLELPAFTQRSLRRMFITRAIELGVDVKVIAEWQGHRDGGQLILKTYSHVRPEHSTRMARLLTTEAPSNIVSMQESA
jgi:integrase